MDSSPRAVTGNCSGFKNDPVGSGPDSGHRKRFAIFKDHHWNIAIGGAFSPFDFKRVYFSEYLSMRYMPKRS